MGGLLYPKESRILLGLAMQLHKELGCGFKEKVYQDAFEVLLKENDIPYEREKHIVMVYHGVQLEHDFYYDFLCYGKIGVELKAFVEITGEFQFENEEKVILQFSTFLIKRLEKEGKSVWMKNSTWRCVGIREL